MSLSTAPITVITPCLNAARTLGDAIESVLAQTVRPAEILVIDDGSSDHSARVARSFGPPVRVLTQAGRGIGAARRLGVREAAGAFIAFIDADDLIEPTKHEKQLAVLESSDPYTVVHTGWLKFWPDGSRPDRAPAGGELATGHCTRVIFERNPVCGASVMIHRSVVLEIGNYDADLVSSPDYNLSLRASTRCTFVHLPEVLYRARKHAGNTSSRACRMAYMHWLAQEKFRQRCPDAFDRLPPGVVREFMIEPVLRAVREAYWRRDGRDYARLLRLAARLDPADPVIQTLWSRRWVPMTALRAWDRAIASGRPPVVEAS